MSAVGRIELAAPIFLNQIYEEYFCLWGIFHGYLAYKQVGRETYRDS